MQELFNNVLRLDALQIMSDMNPFSSFPILVDPDSHSPLKVNDTGDSKSLDSESGTSFPVLDNIPRVLAEQDNYAAAFGDQWNKWRSTQLDSFTGTTISRDRFERCLGPDALLLLRDDQSTLDVLEAGCGAGRFSEILLGYPATRLTSVDLSNAVEANQVNFPQNELHRIVQCDICKPPFRPGAFDLVICLGVIQHTPIPEVTIKKLFELVKPGGSLIIDHYRPELRRLTKVGVILLRPIIKRLPPSLRMKVCVQLVSAFLPLHRAVRKVPFGQTILSRLSPITTYYHAYPQLSEEMQREWAVLDTHDGLTDWNKHLRTASQIRKTLESLGAVQIEVNQGGNGVEARCKKAN